MNQTLSFLPYSDAVEQKVPHEDEIIEKVQKSFEHTQHKMPKDAPAQRTVHSKNHGVLKGQLDIYPNLPMPYQQGAFISGKSYPVMLRFSTAPSGHHKDDVGGVRGMGLKLLNITGEHCLPTSVNAETQDFLFVNHPTFAVANIADFVPHAYLLEKVISNTPEVVQEVTGAIARGIGNVARAVGVDPLESPFGLMKSESHILGQTFYTTAPIRYGDYVAKVSVAPLSGNVVALQNEVLEMKEDSAILAAVEKFFKMQSAEYEFRVQLCTNLDDMPVEDLTVRWSEEQSPYYPIGKISFSAQNPGSPKRSQYADEVLSFTPWNALIEHRPLGSIMRARKPVYESSSQYRHEQNVKPKKEPNTLNDMPD